jgi:hypothetical protein
MSHSGLDQRYAGEEGQKDERQNWKLRSHVCLFIQNCVQQNHRTQVRVCGLQRSSAHPSIHGMQVLRNKYVSHSRGFTVKNLFQEHAKKRHRPKSVPFP